MNVSFFVIFLAVGALVISIAFGYRCIKLWIRVKRLESREGYHEPDEDRYYYEDEEGHEESINFMLENVLRGSDEKEKVYDIGKKRT